MRDAIVAGVHAGVTSEHGLIAHGRGEAFDYLLGETTHDFARAAVRAAAAMLIEARHPVVSVNGNAAALVPEALARLALLVDAPLEVNIFHSSAERERAIGEWLRARGGARVLLPTREAELDFIDSNRRFVHPEGIHRADVIFVPLEDGDRCRALRQMGRHVVTVDLNPLSRTARASSIAIVDNVARSMPLLLDEVENLVHASASERRAIVDGYDHDATLDAAEAAIRGGGRP